MSEPRPPEPTLYRPFTKMQAVGNDFVLLEGVHWPETTEWSQYALSLCDRRFGVGGDGLLVVLPSSVADIRMRMFNPDGTEDMCGNGLRCVIRYAIDQGLLSGRTGVAETLDDLHPFTCNSDGSITVEMGVPHFALEAIPFDRSSIREKFRATQTNERLFVGLPGGSTLVDAVNTGSTHSVLWREQLPEDTEFFQISPLIENAREFPERTSVLWAVVEDSTTVRLRIWERGAGETLGCGTGACAAAVLGRRSGRIAPEGDIVVHSRGGSLTVSWSGKDTDPMYLTGTAQSVYTGILHD